MKKSVVLLLFLIFGINFLSFVCSQTYSSGMGYWDFRSSSHNIIDLVVDFSEPFLQVILGGYDYTGFLLFERFLLFVLILSIVFLSLKNVPFFKEGDTKGPLWVVVVIVSLLAIRWLNYEWLNTILLQYQILGVAVTAIIPFLVYLFFYIVFLIQILLEKLGGYFLLLFILDYGLLQKI